jgi:hypothetical protein
MDEKLRQEIEKLAEAAFSLTDEHEPCKISSKDAPCPVPFKGCRDCILNRLIALIDK